MELTQQQLEDILKELGYALDDPFTFEDVDAIENVIDEARNAGVERLDSVLVWDTSDSDDDDFLITLDLDKSSNLRLCSHRIELSHVREEGLTAGEAIKHIVAFVLEEMDRMLAELNKRYEVRST